MISKIHIKNFRSIKDLIIEPKNLCGLVGMNSAGKTNILKALNILLGETYPTERSFSKDDFYNRCYEEEIFIQIWFEEPLEKCKLTSKENNNKEYCFPDSFIFKHTKKESASISTEFTVINQDGRAFYGSDAARNQISFIYIPSDRNLEKQMSVSQWTLLGKILQRIDGNFRKNSDLENAFKKAMIEPKNILESEFSTGITYKSFKEIFIKMCEQNAEGLTQSFSLDLEIYDPLFYYKTIQLLGIDELGKFNVQELGSGVQNLVLLALFRTYAKVMKNKAVFAIEEPEIYLYPQAQRQLFNSFINLAYPEDGGVGTQIFYTTHNPNFVNANRADEVEMIFKDRENGTCKLNKNKIITKQFLQDAKFKIYTHFNTERNELFFARKIILVEGDADKILFSTLCEKKWMINLNKESVSIIECGGKGGVMYFIGVCRLLGMKNVYAVWDEDPEQATNDHHGNFNYQIDSKNGWEIKPNLEVFLKSKFPEYVFRDDYKVEDAYKWASDVDINSVPNEFNSVRNFILTRNDSVNQCEPKDDGNEIKPCLNSIIKNESEINLADLPF